MYPAIIFLKKKYPESKIDLMSRKSNEKIINWIGEIDNHLIFNDKEVISNVKTATSSEHRKLKNLVKFIKSNRTMYDLIFVFQKSKKALLLAALLQPKKALIGYQSGIFGKFLSSSLVEIDSNEREYIKHLKLVNADDYQFKKGLIPRNVKIKPEVSNAFLKKEKVLTINAFAKWDTRSLDIHQIEKLVEEVFDLDKTIRIIFVGLNSQFKAVEKIRLKYISKIDNFLGETSLEELYFILKKSSAFLTVDSGPMHIAAHTNTRVYAIFGPTSPKRAGYDEHNIFTGLCAHFPCESSICQLENKQCILNQNMSVIARKIVKDLSVNY